MGFLARLSALAFLIAHPAIAGRNAPEEGARFSARAQVVEAIAGVKKDFLQALLSDAQNMQILNDKYAKDRELREALQSMRGESNAKAGAALLKDLEQVEFQPRSNCRDRGGNFKDATTAPARKAPICFSISRLRRFPKEQLRAEIASLALHQLARHFGQNEIGATKFELYLRELVHSHDLKKRMFKSLREPVRGMAEIRPGGRVDINGANGRNTVVCLKANERAEDFSELLKTGDLTFIASGEMVIRSSPKGFAAVECRNYPKIDCADLPSGWSTSQQTRAVHAGVCERKAASAPLEKAAPLQPKRGQSAE